MENIAYSRQSWMQDSILVLAISESANDYGVPSLKSIINDVDIAAAKTVKMSMDSKAYHECRQSADDSLSSGDAITVEAVQTLLRRVRLGPIPILQDGHWQRLIDHAWSGDNRYIMPPFATFTTLQRLNILHLQNELAGIKSHMWDRQTEKNENQINELGIKLHQYVRGIKDLRYMLELPKASGPLAFQTNNILRDTFPAIGRPPNGARPFFTDYITLFDSTEQKPDMVREALHKFIPGPDRDEVVEGMNVEERYYLENPQVTHAKTLNRVADSITVSLLAVLGGSSLLVPMIIMVLDPSLTKSLITTSVAVVVFGFCTGFLYRENPKNILSLTTAYAAVLVVFVGTNNTGS